MFEKELAFFIDHQDELVSKYRGKTLIIRGNSVEGAFDSTLEAYIAAQQKFEAGSFMIQPCAPGPGAYTVLINSRHT